MKTLKVITLVLLFGLMLFPLQAQAAEDSRFMRIDIDNIQVKRVLSANTLAKLNDVTKEASISVASGDTLQTSFLFPLVSPATWSVRMSGENGKILLAVEGELKVSENSVDYKVTSASIDDESLNLKSDASAVLLVVGRVSGSLEAEVSFANETEAVIFLGIDTNADGKVADNEITQQKVKAASADISTPVIDSIPLTAGYNVSVLAGNATVASSIGSYDFVKGQSVKAAKSIDPKKVTQLSVTYNRVPYVATIALPNSIFQLPAGTMRAEPQSEESTVDILKASSAPPQSISGKALENTNSSARDVWEQISDFLSHYWPLLAIVGAVLVGMLLLFKLVFRLK